MTRSMSRPVVRPSAPRSVLPVAAIAAFLAGVAAPAALFAQTADPSDPASPPVVAAQLLQPLLVQPITYDRADRMTLPVSINGQGPFGFVVDTGAERTVVSHELAARLGLARTGSARVVGIAQAVTTDLYAANDIRLHDLALGDRIVPGFAQADIGGPGLIGVDSLQNHRLVIDFVAGRMDIRDSAPSRRVERDEDFDRDVIVVVARRAAGRLILSNATINGRRIDVVLDTGAQTSVGNLALQRLVTRERQHGAGGGTSQLTSVTGGSLAVETGQIGAITVGGVDFTNLPVAYADSPAFAALGLARRPAILLGMDALRLFDRVSIDFTNHRVVFDMPDQARRSTAGRLAQLGGPQPAM